MQHRWRGLLYVGSFNYSLYAMLYSWMPHEKLKKCVKQYGSATSPTAILRIALGRRNVDAGIRFPRGFLIIGKSGNQRIRPDQTDGSGVCLVFPLT